MTLSEDFEDFIKTLNKRHVDYLIVGGYAMIWRDIKLIILVWMN